MAKLISSKVPQKPAIPVKTTAEGDIIYSLNAASNPEIGGLKPLAIKMPPVGAVKALSGEQADKLIQTIRNSGQKMKQTIHTTACGILLHYVEHGDYSRMIRLHAAVREALGAAAANNLAAWVSYYSTVKWNADGGDGGNYFDSVKGMGKAEKRFALTAIDAKTNTEIGAYSKPFYNTAFGSAAEPRQADARAMIAGVYTRIEKLLEDNKEKKAHHVVSEKFIADLKDFLLSHGVTFNGDKPVVPDKPVIEDKREAKTEVVKAKKPRAKRAKKAPAIEVEAPAIH